MICLLLWDVLHENGSQSTRLPHMKMVPRDHDLFMGFLFGYCFIQNFCNIIYFVMTYFIIKDILIIIYLFYYLQKN